MNDSDLPPLELDDPACADWFVEVLNHFGLLDDSVIATAVSKQAKDSKAFAD
jgi:hypothetical protein